MNEEDKGNEGNYDGSDDNKSWGWRRWRRQQEMAKGDDGDYPFLQLMNLPLSYHVGVTTATAAPTDRAKGLRWGW